MIMMHKIIHGDCLDIMKEMEDNSIDFIVTDSPYGISFMSKKWDQQIPPIEYWQEMLRICKPGSMMACAGLPRMYHRLACVVEDAGWQVRDCIMHIFGSGFPKSHNKFGFEGYGTALKPAYEPWLLCMKPIEKTFANNAEKWGVGGINIDGCRIGTSKDMNPNDFDDSLGGERKDTSNHTNSNLIKGRWPANLILDESAAEQLDQMTGNNSSRFFYCAKSSSSERNKGLEGMPLKESRPLGISNWEGQTNGSGDVMGKSKPQYNSHPTVKPISLMKYIIKLLAPPGNPILLDPFAGSGSTLVAAKEQGISAIGIEKEQEYIEIANKRLEAAQCLTQMEMFNGCNNSS